LESMKRVSPLAMSVWQLRLIFFMFIPAFLLFFFYYPQSLVWKLCVIAAGAGFAFVSLLWLPVKYLKLSYRLDGNTLYIRWGVVYTRFSATFLENIQYVSVSATPLQRIFHLCSVNFILAGGRMSIPCISAGEGEMLRVWGSANAGGGKKALP